MNCFILPARVREARARSFPLEPRAYTAQQHPAKRLRYVAWDDQVTVPPPAVTTRAQATSRLPTPTLVVGQEEEYMEEISEEEDDVDILGFDLPPGQGQAEVTQVEEGQEQLPPPIHNLIARAAHALDIELPTGQTRKTSRFDDEGDQPRPRTIPLLSDVEDLVLEQFSKPADAHRWSGLTRRLAGVEGRERIGCGQAPPMDQALGALVSPTSSVLGKPSCPSRNTRAMDSNLTRVHGVLAIQGQLVNTGAILALYQNHLTRQLGSGAPAPHLVAELQQVSSLLAKSLKEQAVAAGRALASLWVARRHLWLSQSQLQTDDRSCLLRLPVVPSAMFGPGATAMLEQARDARRCAREMSGVLQSNRSRWVSGAPRAMPRAAAPQPTQAAPDDLRVQLDTARRSRAGRGRRMGRGRGRGRGPRAAPPRP